MYGHIRPHACSACVEETKLNNTAGLEVGSCVRLQLLQVTVTELRSDRTRNTCNASMPRDACEDSRVCNRHNQCTCMSVYQCTSVTATSSTRHMRNMFVVGLLCVTIVKQVGKVERQQHQNPRTAIIVTHANKPHSKAVGKPKATAVQKEMTSSNFS